MHQIAWCGPPLTHTLTAAYCHSQWESKVWSKKACCMGMTFQPLVYNRNSRLSCKKTSEGADGESFSARSPQETLNWFARDLGNRDYGLLTRVSPQCRVADRLLSRSRDTSVWMAWAGNFLCLKCRGRALSDKTNVAFHAFRLISRLFGRLPQHNARYNFHKWLPLTNVDGHYGSIWWSQVSIRWKWHRTAEGSQARLNWLGATMVTWENVAHEQHDSHISKTPGHRATNMTILTSSCFVIAQIHLYFIILVTGFMAIFSV